MSLSKRKRKVSEPPQHDQYPKFLLIQGSAELPPAYNVAGSAEKADSPWNIDAGEEGIMAVFEFSHHVRVKQVRRTEAEQVNWSNGAWYEILSD